MKMKALWLFVAIFPVCVAHADTDISDVARSVFNQNMSTATPQSTTSSAAVGETSGNAAVPSAGPSIAPGATTGQNSQSAGQAINMAASAALMAACLSHDPPHWALCAMGALAAAQGAHDGGAAGQSGLTYGSASENTTPSPTANADGTSSFSNPEVKKGLDALQNAGYQVSPTGVTLPDGTTVPASAFNSASSMTSAGIDSSAAAEAQRVSKAINDEMAKYNQPHVASVGVDSGGGGGGSSAKGGDSDAMTPLPRFNNPFALNDAARKKMMAGKTVMFEGEPIGVRGQDIFDMVHTAYERKRINHNFIESDDGSVSVRAPASVIKRK